MEDVPLPSSICLNHGGIHIISGGVEITLFNFISLSHGRITITSSVHLVSLNNP